MRDLVAQLDHEALAELEQAVWLVLFPEQTARERRVAELGFLASLLRDRPPREGSKYPVISRAEYETRRPRDAPRGATLVWRYRSWPSACHAASSLLPDGRWLERGRPWPTANRGRRREKPYTSVRRPFSDPSGSTARGSVRFGRDVVELEDNERTEYVADVARVGLGGDVAIPRDPAVCRGSLPIGAGRARSTRNFKQLSKNAQATTACNGGTRPTAPSRVLTHVTPA